MTHKFQVREKAATSLGELCVGDANFPYKKNIIEGMLESAQPKQFELHFTIGEALVNAAQGTASPAARDVWLTSEEDYKVSYVTTSFSYKHRVENLSVCVNWACHFVTYQLFFTNFMKSASKF